MYYKYITILSRMIETASYLPHDVDIEANIIKKLEAAISIQMNEINKEIKILKSYCVISIGLIAILYVKNFT
jgi:hypothetical protein